MYIDSLAVFEPARPCADPSSSSGGKCCIPPRSSSPPPSFFPMSPSLPIRSFSLKSFPGGQLLGTCALHQPIVILSCSLSLRPIRSQQHLGVSQQPLCKPPPPVSHVLSRRSGTHSILICRSPNQLFLPSNALPYRSFASSVSSALPFTIATSL